METLSGSQIDIERSFFRQELSAANSVQIIAVTRLTPNALALSHIRGICSFVHIPAENNQAIFGAAPRGGSLSAQHLGQRAAY